MQVASAQKKRKAAPTNNKNKKPLTLRQLREKESKKRRRIVHEVDHVKPGDLGAEKPDQSGDRPPDQEPSCRGDPPVSSPKVVEGQKSAVARTRVVRLQRKGGRIVQNCDVYIGRRWTMGGWDLPQSKWANPFSVKRHAGGSVAEAVRMYEEYIKQKPELMACLGELRGKVLGCWCKKKPDDPCHGDVLARLADAAPES